MTSLHPGPVLPEDPPDPTSIGARYPHRYAALDVETTGFSAAKDRVVQVAVTLLDEHGEVESSWSTLVDPQRDPGPVHVHGITAERLRGAPLFADVAEQLADLLAGRVFVAHNAVFDWGFVAAEMRRAGVELAVEQRLCTRNLAKRLDLPVPDLKLATLAAHWRVEQLRAHDAEDDTRVLVEVLRHALRAAADRDLDLPLTRCSTEPPPPRPRASRRAAVPAAAAPADRRVLAPGDELELPPSGRPWLLDLRWARAAHPVGVAVQRSDALGLPLGAVLRTTRASLDGTVVLDVDTAGEAEVWLHLDASPADVQRVVLLAEAPAGSTFAEAGPLVLALRAPNGSVLALADVVAPEGARTLVVAEVQRHGGQWRLRVPGAAAAAA
ncbi:exonuclease domain-containing protein [Kineococcus arenarius]|uniref:exonuclease domain-containing protein n=1 Tax=Kineococcus sp. SYSU DK007 TaxID=3383128 RepID=UPI003D7CA642